MVNTKLAFLGSPRGSLNFDLEKNPFFEAGAREAGARFLELGAREAGGRFFEAGAREDVRKKRPFFEKRSLENTVLVKW
jgi:hypothetical protein